MSEKIRIELEVDEHGAVRSISAVDSEMGELRNTAEGAESQVNSTKRALEVAFGVMMQRAVEALAGKIKDMAAELKNLSMEIQDVDSEFNAVFRNVQKDADAFVERFREMTGFTTTEARKMASEVAGIALTLGETDEAALELAESSAMLALQWERIAGHKFEDGYKSITLALTGNISEMQRAGIISREMTRTQFDAMTMQQRLALVTDGLTARYGNLDEATDGLTQQNRKLQGQLNEIRDNVIRRLVPIISEMLGELSKWMDENEDLLESLEKLAEFVVVDVAQALLGFIEGLGSLNKELEKTGNKTRDLARDIGWFVNASSALLVVMRLYNKVFSDAEVTTSALHRKVNKAATSQKDLGEKTGGTTEKVEQQKVAVKELTAAWLNFLETAGIEVPTTLDRINLTTEDTERAMMSLSSTAQLAVTELATSFGELLASFDDVPDFGARIRGLAANLLTDFGRMLVSLGTMSLTIAQWNPLGMIAAGTAAIALGSAMRKSAQDTFGGGSSGAVGSYSSSPRTPLPQSLSMPSIPYGAVSTQSSGVNSSIINELRGLSWKVNTSIEMGKLSIELKNQWRKEDSTS
jgi:hypothetical protein